MIANLQSGNDYKFAIEGKFKQRNPFTGSLEENLYAWHEGSTFRYEESAKLNNTSNAQATDLTPTLTWNSVTNASQYRIIVEELQGGSNYVTVHTQYENGTSYTIPQNILNANNDYRISLSAMFSWSPSNTCFANSITMSYGALPVELISFEGKKQEKINLLEWSTASEENNKGFEIERSFDGNQFHNIAFVEGNGTTTNVQDYNFSDNGIQKSSYYRLKQIDFDGKFEYSKTIVSSWT